MTRMVVEKLCAKKVCVDFLAPNQISGKDFLEKVVPHNATGLLVYTVAARCECPAHIHKPCDKKNHMLGQHVCRTKLPLKTLNPYENGLKNSPALLSQVFTTQTLYNNKTFIHPSDPQEWQR